MKKSVLSVSALFVLLLSSCCVNNKMTSHTLDVASHQSQQLIDIIAERRIKGMPRTTKKNAPTFSSIQDWTSGFFPGTLWYLSELTESKEWQKQAINFTEKLESIQHLKWHHDIGFMIGCSYGVGYQFTQNKAYQDIIVQSAKSLCTRFREPAGVIQSWNTTGGWQAKRGWQCPVIIDNMMNLEILFLATQFTGDSTYYKVATSHANQTLRHHFRNDNSCYHVIDYDLTTGQVRGKQTAQGYAHESAWARGQAWGLYGFVMSYRFTKDQQYLDQALQIADYIMTHKNTPKDKVPYWDYDAPKDLDYRDASAAAIIASALYELAEYEGKKYRKYADQILASLQSEDYLSEKGANGGFILKHCVGSIPHKQEIDTPLVYADYYLLEAIYRQKNGI